MDGMKVKRRIHRRRPYLRWVLLGALLALLVGSIAAWQAVEHSQKKVVPLPGGNEDVILVRRSEDEVARIEVTLRSGETWAVTAGADGTLVTDSGFPVAPRRAEALLADLSVIGCTGVLAASGWQDRAAEFGLDVPKAAVTVTYTDGTSVHLDIGNSSGEADSENYYYMTLAGDERLLALDAGTGEDLLLEEGLLHEVEQPVIHKARIDRIELTLADGTRQVWALDGSITDGDAEDRWFLEEPVRYPAEGDRVASLRENLASLRLGAYVTQATPETLAAYGFDAPRLVLTVHQAAGSIGTVGLTGEYDVTDWPASELTFTVGGEQSEVVDYVLYNGAIYLTSHFSMNTFMTIEPANTVTRYPVRTAFSNLASLTIRRENDDVTYVLTRTERVAANNDLEIGDDGQVLYDAVCTRNGEEISWMTFEAAYGNLLLTTVSGTLPDGWKPAAGPTEEWIFCTVTGVEHTIALTPFDAMHDAVLVDGCAMFYLIHGGLHLDLP